MIDGVLKSRECIPVQHLAPRLVAGLTAVVVLMSTSLLLCLLDLLALRFLQKQMNYFIHIRHMLMILESIHESIIQ